MSDRCEPPPELRGVDGWHWVQLSRSEEPTIARWKASCAWWNASGLGTVSAESAGNFGYIYISPVATPAEVEALRAERDEALKLQGEVHRLRTGIKLLADTVRAWGWQSKAQESNGELVGRALHDIRARVAELEGALVELVAQRDAHFHTAQAWDAARSAIARATGAAP